MKSIIPATVIYYLSQTQSNAFTTPLPRTSHPSTSHLPSLVSDSSDYKAESSEYDSEDPMAESSYGRNDDDMASVTPVEQFPVPMSRNNVGSRWIAIVLDREMHKGYNGEIYDGEPIIVADTFNDDMDDDEDDGEDVDVEEEDYEDPTELDMSVKLPEFQEAPVIEKRTAFDGQTLQIMDRHEMDNLLENKGYDNDHILWKMHKERVALTEKHVMWARKQNLYNETFNTESMADVLWSHQILSSDLQRAIGHVMCIDSPTLADCREALSRDPIIQKLVGVDPKTGTCDASSVPLYRWRHIRDHTLRRDDGRNGLPNMLLAFDHPEATADGVRKANYNKHLEYMIRSERIIAAGPLHVATEEKMDPKSVPVGTLMLFNAKDREHAVEFVENDPLALEGLYDTMTVSRYNMLDVTGKFVIRNQYFPDDETSQMKEAMGVWGYPVNDDQTKWLNW